MKHLIFVTKILLLTSFIGLIAGCNDHSHQENFKEMKEHPHSHD